MAGKQLISEVVDKVAVRGELSELSKALKDIDTQIRNMSQISIGGRKNGADFKKVNEQMIQEIAKSEAALAKLQTAIANKQAALDKAAAAQLIAEQKVQNAITQTEIINNRASKSAQQNANAAAAAKQREQKQNDELINDYKQLSLAYNDASLKAKNYALQLGMQHPVTLQAIADANSMGDQLKKLDASVGQHQRNVGNYASGWSSFNNVIRETPNFAISATTGIQALSNNIPMFADEIKKARTEGKSWMGILKELGANLFSFGGIATIATIALTALPKILAAMSNNTKESAIAMEIKAKAVGIAKSEVEKLKETTENYNKTLDTNNENAEKEITNLRVLEKVATDTSKSMDVRVSAVKKIQELYPAYLDNLSQDEILSGKAASAINEITSALYKKAIAEAASSRSAETAKNLLDLRKEEATLLQNEQKIRDELEKSKNNRGRQGAVGGSSTGVTGTELDSYDKAIEKLTKIKDRIEQNRTAQLLFGRDIQFYNEESAKLYDQYYKLEIKKEDAAKGGNKKTKDLKEEERKFLYEMNKAILEAQAANLDQIAKDESNSYAVRIVATQEYLKKVNEIAKLQRDFEINTPKITNAEKLKVQSEYNLKTVENENKMLTAIREMKKDHDKKVLDQQKQAQEDAEKARQDKIDSAESKINDRVLRDQELLNNELKDLNERFINGDIKSYEDYQKEKEQIALRYAIKTVEHQIQATEALLKSDILTNDERQKYATQLADLKKKLTDTVIEHEKNANKTIEKTESERVRKLLRNLQLIKDAVNAVTEAIGAAFSVGYEKRAVALEEERTAIEKNSAAEVKKITDSTLSEQQKADKLKILESEKQVQLETNERKNRQLQYERAKFERALSIGNIIASTAQAVLHQLKTGDPYTAVARSIIAGTIGAAQLFKVLATPLPKFAKGTDYAPGGYALTDEEGAEMYIEPSGKTYMGSDDGANVKWVERGTKIIPHHEVMKMAMQHNLSKTLNMVERGDNTSKKIDELKEVTIWSTLELKKAMGKQKGTTVVVNNNAAFQAHINKYVHE